MCDGDPKLTTFALYSFEKELVPAPIGFYTGFTRAEIRRNSYTRRRRRSREASVTRRIERSREESVRIGEAVL